MRTLLVIIWTMLRQTSPLAPHNTPPHNTPPHNTPPHNTPQSLWRTTQQINAHTTQHYGPVLVACTARDFLRGCAGVEAFSTTEHGCDCVLESLNVSVVNCGDGTALLRAALDGSATLALRSGQNTRPPRARFVDGGAVFEGKGDDVCELAIALGGDAFDGTKGTVGACTLIRRGADAVLTGDDVAHVVAPLPSYHTLPTAGAAWAASVVDELVRQGVDRFVIAPGARSAPLALACARDPHVRRNLRVVHDERAAAFYALGHARARGGSCACVVTTSGTAVANLLPAACEADRDSIPIVFATADRPAEMRGVGADQVLERQQDLLRSTVRRAADLPPADDRIAALGDLGEVSSIAAAALREEDPVSTRSGK